MLHVAFPCPCCGYPAFDHPPNSHYICGICGWEDDALQLRWPDYACGANKSSLEVAQLYYERHGATDERSRSYLRPVTSHDVKDAG